MLRFPCNYSRFRTRLVPFAQLQGRRYTSTPEQLAPNAIPENDPIHRINLRVGQIVSVEHHPEASHLFIEQGKHYSLYSKGQRLTRLNM